MSVANTGIFSDPTARGLTLELVRVTEAAAIAAARLRGHGREKEADQAAVDAMRAELMVLPIEGRVVIGEGERDEAPMLFIGEPVGTGHGPSVDIAVDPLEGTTLFRSPVPLVLITYAATEGNVRKALAAIDRDGLLAEAPQLIRIERE